MHGVLSLAGPALLPRCLLDGRFFGPLRPLAESAAVLAQHPGLLLGQQLQALQALQPAAAAEPAAPGAEAAAKPAPLRLLPPPLLAVTTVQQDAAAAAQRAAAQRRAALVEAALSSAGGAGGAGSADAAAAAAASSSSFSGSSSARSPALLPAQLLQRSAPFAGFGVSGGDSRFSLSLFRNLLPASRAALLVGFDPLSALLASLQAVHGRSAAFFPFLCFQGHTATAAAAAAAEEEEQQQQQPVQCCAVVGVRHKSVVALEAAATADGRCEAATTALLPSLASMAELGEGFVDAAFC
jgi:hypothetical protein